MRLKVLPLDPWMTYDWMLEECREGGHYPEVTHGYGRDGIYLWGEHSWFEVSGKSYRYPTETFKYSLLMLELEKYNHRQIKALDELVGQRMATKEQKRLLGNCIDCLALRWTGRNSAKHVLQFKKRIKNGRKKREAIPAVS